VSTTNNLGEEMEVTKDIEEGWDQNWKDYNVEFKYILNANLDSKMFSNKMFYVWDGNHRLKVWYLCIDRVHQDENY
jgi:hypothetical protein